MTETTKSPDAARPLGASGGITSVQHGNAPLPGGRLRRLLRRFGWHGMQVVTVNDVQYFVRGRRPRKVSLDKDPPPML